MNDKFSSLPEPIARASRDWESAAIEKCRKDPALKAAGLCPVCMISLPVCHCVDHCARCGQPFGSYGCQCPGRFTSAFDKSSGKKLTGAALGARIAAMEPLDDLWWAWYPVRVYNTRHEALCAGGWSDKSKHSRIVFLEPVRVLRRRDGDEHYFSEPLGPIYYLPNVGLHEPTG
jgi:hypothetical protein